MLQGNLKSILFFEPQKLVDRPELLVNQVLHYLQSFLYSLQTIQVQPESKFVFRRQNCLKHSDALHNLTGYGIRDPLLLSATGLQPLLHYEHRLFHILLAVFDSLGDDVVLFHVEAAEDPDFFQVFFNVMIRVHYILWSP